MDYAIKRIIKMHSKTLFVFNYYVKSLEIFLEGLSWQSK